MRVPNVLRSGEVGFNMTPMIDVVFLLIIFFLVSSHLAKQEAQMPLELPLTASRLDTIDSQAAKVIINLREDGQMVLAGRRVDMEGLTRRLQAEREAVGPELMIQIRMARRAPYEHLQKVLLACAKSGFWNVVFNVYRREDQA